MRFRSVALLVGLALSAGCGPIYIPPSANVPLLEERGQVHITGQAGSNGGQIGGAVAVTDALALRGRYQAFSPEFADGDSDIERYRMFEGGIGYYWAERDLPFLHGYPRGSVSLDLGSGSSTGADYDGDFHRVAGQVAFASEGRHLTLGGALRLAYVGFTESGSGNEANGVFAEPVVLGRIGFAGLKLELQNGLALPLDDLDDHDQPGAVVGVPFFVSAGIVIDF